MNSLPRLKPSLLNSTTSGQLRGWISGLPTLPALFWRRRSARIIVRLVKEGFTATLISSNPKKTFHVIWSGDTGWQPDVLFTQLLRKAQERPADLELSREFVLSHSIKLPEAALTNLSEAITYGLSSWSPFQAEDVYVSGYVEEVRDGQALIRLHYALRPKVDPVIARLDAVGLGIDRIILDVASSLTVALKTPKLSHLKRSRRIDGALAATAFLLVFVLGSTQIMMMSRKLEETQSALQSELSQLRRAEALQTAYTAYMARRAAVADRRARETSAYELLLALAQQLPDGVLIQALEIDKGRGRIDLSGSDPDGIVQALRGIPLIRNPKADGADELRGISVTFELPERRP